MYKEVITVMDKNENRIYHVLTHWGFSAIEIKEQFNRSSSRLIYRVTGDGEELLLKGIPDSKPEEAIKGNVSAHKYLGNEKHIAPNIIKMPAGSLYLKESGYWFYLMEYIKGRAMKENISDEYSIGKLTRQLHSHRDYPYKSSLNEDPARFYQWFKDKEFKADFDKIISNLPDFSKYDRCFIHTDIGPHNAMVGNNGQALFIDLDDAGIGSRYLDLGWPFIMQFVDFNHNTGEMNYRFDLAKSFLRGYYGNDLISPEEYDLLWQGATYMHISYMKSYGPEAVDSLWNILKFGMEQKDKLYVRLKL